MPAIERGVTDYFLSLPSLLYLKIAEANKVFVGLNFDLKSGAIYLFIYLY